MLAPPEANSFDRAVAIVFLSGLSITLLWTAYLKRHWYAFNVAKFVTCFVLWCALRWFFHSIGVHGAWVYYVTVAMVMPLFVLIAWKPTRSRRVRRDVIADYEAYKGAGSYDSTKLHVDHFYASKLQGGHTRDNLWVIPKTENLKKGAQPPSLEQWMRFAAYRWHVWRDHRRRARQFPHVI